MGCDVNIFLPPTARLERVATALATLSGVKPIVSGNFTMCNARFRTHDQAPEMVNIEFTVPGEYSRTIKFHFEINGSEPAGGPQSHGWKFIHMPSTALNIALAKAVVDLFGGKVVYQDTENGKDFSNPDYEKPEYKYNAACDGQPYEIMQKRLASIQRLTQDQIQACAKLAGYDKDEVID